MIHGVYWSLLGLLSLALLIYRFTQKRYPVQLKVGDYAPNFHTLDDQSAKRSLAEFRGHHVVLYFYPKSDTPGCTHQACQLRDTFDIYRQHHIIVLGITYDIPNDLSVFKKKYQLPFVLLSDTTKAIAKKYGAYQSSINTLFPARITFLIDKTGHITAILKNVNVTTHAQDILKLFSK
jgi:thioredoxin-dependent peroxiredoxin